MSFGGPQQQQMVPPSIPNAPPPPPMFGAIQGQKPQKKPQQSTFLGADTIPSPGNTGQKTLLGQ